MPRVRLRKRALFAALRLLCRIFFALNWQDLPEYFEDHMQEWMTEFHAYLVYENALLVDADEEDESGPVERLQAAVIENLKLYADGQQQKTLINSLMQRIECLEQRIA